MIKYIKEHKYLLWLIYVPIYIIGFFGMEKIVTNDTPFFSTVLPIDSCVPFFEWAVLPYMLWYPFMAAVGLYILFTDRRAFSRYMCFMTIGFSFSIIFCLLFPNGTAADFRPDIAELGRENIATWILENFIWANDTYTNVIPSIHVVGSFMAMFGFFDSNLAKNKWLSVITCVLTLLITASTVFTKQHSILDVLAGLLFSIILYFLVYVLFRGIMDKKYAKTEEKE